MKKISLIIPVYNEESTLDTLYAKILELDKSILSGKYDLEILFINDGSIDRTPEKLANLRNADQRINYISLSRNFGKENAMLAGFDYVQGDCALIMDADLQDPIEVIPEMIYWWEQGYEDVYGTRISRGKESFLRKYLSVTFYKIMQRSSRFEILPNVGDFRLLDIRCIKVLRQLRETQRYTKGLFAWIGFKKKEVKFHRGDSIRQWSSFSYGKLFNLAMSGLTSFTTAPLSIVSILGLVIAFCAICYLIFILCKTIFFGEPIQGFPTIICTILILGGMQLLALGIIGEYIGRIFNESKNRPVYVVDSINGERV